MTKPAPPSKLSGAALRKLRALGHDLAPVVAIGKEGLRESLVKATDQALETHELIKIKIQREAPVDRHEAGIDLAARTGSVLAQVIGRTLLLYRRHPKKPKIQLPVPGAKTKAKAKPAASADKLRTTSAPAVENEDGIAGEDGEN